MIIEDLDQRLRREVIDGTGVVVLEMSRHHAQLNRVSVLTSLRENRAMLRTWAILKVTGADPESRLWRKEKQVQRSEWVEAEEEWVRIRRRPRRDLFSPHDAQGGPELSDIPKRRESMVCSIDGGELSTVDRW